MQMFRMLIGACLLALPLSTVALRDTDTESYTDPDFVDLKLDRVAVVTENAGQKTREGLLQVLEKRLKKKGVELVDYFRLFPPTRDWSAQDRERIYEENDITAILIVTAGASASAVIPIATNSHTYGSATLNGNSASYSGNTTTYRTYATSSSADFSAVLLDVETGRVAWYCDLTTEAGGALFVSSKNDGKGAARGIVRALAADGHLPD